MKIKKKPTTIEFSMRLTFLKGFNSVTFIIKTIEKGMFQAWCYDMYCIQQPLFAVDGHGTAMILDYLRALIRSYLLC